VNQAHAYLDPATGSMIIQAVIAIVAAAAVSIGIYWGRLKVFLGGLFGRKKDECKRLFPSVTSACPKVGFHTVEQRHTRAVPREIFL